MKINAKTLFIFSILNFLTIQLNAQVVDESINGIQVGFIGLWVHNESKIAPNWALRTEVGYESPLNTGLYGISNPFTNESNEFPLFLPVGTMEVKWYYNSPKRQGNSKNYFHNSSNFASLGIRYYPEFGAISAHKITEIDGGLFLIPSWGIRRNISYRLNYELGVGLGIDLYELLTSERSTTDVNFNVLIRLGYKFGKKAFGEGL